MSPNVLSQRLRDLEEGGIVRRDALDPPAAVAVYELTDRGLALEPILLELGRWGSAERASVTLETDAETLRSVAFGREPITVAERDGRLAIGGDRRLAKRFARMFPVPAG